MNSFERKIEIKESDIELLLFVPPRHKERAKAVSDSIGTRRDWDNGRQCWVFPKTVRAYDALVAEFGDDLTELLVARPESIRRPVPLEGQQERLVAENESLRQEIASVREAVERLASSDLRDNLSLKSQSLLEARESEIAELQRQIRSQAEKLATTLNELDEARRVSTVFQGADHESESGGNGKTTTASFKRDFRETLKKLAVYTAGRDSPFNQVMHSLPLDTHICNALLRELDAELQRRLGTTDRTSSADLISQARDSQILTQEGAHLAHLIRSQRNIVIYAKRDDPRRHTFQARAIMCLFAASLLWPEFEQPQ